MTDDDNESLDNLARLLHDLLNAYQEWTKSEGEFLSQEERGI